MLSGEATFGIAHTFAADLALLRPGVELVAGSEVRVARTPRRCSTRATSWW